MADITHYFPIKSPVQKVFDGIAKPEGLDRWWTKSSKGIPGLDQPYDLNFGAGFRWKGMVTQFEPEKRIEWTLTEADRDWIGTKVGFVLSRQNDLTMVDFYHSGWQESSDHYRTSCYCWAMYLRILKRYLEYGEQVPYEDRLEV